MERAYVAAGVDLAFELMNVFYAPENNRLAAVEPVYASRFWE